MGSLMGAWFDDDTPLEEICDFHKRNPLRANPPGVVSTNGFLGDRTGRFTFGGCRASAASLYAWHAEHAASPEDKQRMLAKADVAFRQAFTLSPSLPKTVWLYANFLKRQGRIADAIKVEELSLLLEPNDPWLGFIEQAKTNAPSLNQMHTWSLWESIF